MIVALHSAPRGFFKKEPPYNTSDALKLVHKAASMGFKGFQVGPLWAFPNLDGSQLKKRFDALKLERNVHVGGIYHAENFVTGKGEFEKALKEAFYGIELCSKVSSKLASLHPPFFLKSDELNEAVFSKRKDAFLELVRRAVEFADSYRVTVALESFCYPPFIFSGIEDFAKFVHNFPPDKLGILADVGHLFQAGFNVDKFLHNFGNRLVDLHVNDATLERDVRKATHLPVGKGRINFVHLIGVLREIDYDGWFTLEIQGSEQEILESKEALEKIIAKSQI